MARRCSTAAGGASKPIEDSRGCLVAVLSNLSFFCCVEGAAMADALASMSLARGRFSNGLE